MPKNLLVERVSVTDMGNIDIEAEGNDSTINNYCVNPTSPITIVDDGVLLLWSGL